MNRQATEVSKQLLTIESKELKDLRKIYQQSLSDVNRRINELSNSMEQSKIYQKKYQEQLRDQLQESLKVLNDKTVNSVDDFLTRTGEEAFVGQLYQFSSDVPFMMPINNELISQSVNKTVADYTFSERLYSNTEKLAQNVIKEVSRGFATGLSYQETALNLAFAYNTSYKNAVRIARTESHRVSQEVSFGVAKDFKNRGCDIVKQWDSAMDDRTRETHVDLDGQIKELDEPFVTMYGQEAMYPGAFGDPAEDINCRCVIVERARWALGDDYTKFDKSSGEIVNVSSKDYKDYKENYRDWVNAYSGNNEKERIRSSSDYAVQSSMLNSREFIDKVKSIFDDPTTQREAYKNIKTMLTHRSGTNGEDIIVYNTKTHKWIIADKGKKASEPKYSVDLIKEIEKYRDQSVLVAIHNHPASMPPSIEDINSVFTNGYNRGYVVCHNGRIFEYTSGDCEIDEYGYNLRIADYLENGYNNFEAQLLTIKHMSEMYNFTFKEVTSHED